jgi:hypothetical protein
MHLFLPRHHFPGVLIYGGLRIAVNLSVTDYLLGVE